MEDSVGPTGAPGSLERLCTVSLRACQLMNPLASAIYSSLQSSTGSGMKMEKRDNSAFTIADGLVQRLLTEALFSNVSFRDIVGEEDDGDRADASGGGWYRVQGLTVPEELRPLLDKARGDVEALATEHLSSKTDKYNRLTVFIDPIDGTREFASGRGEQCSVCIGFANEHGKAVAGVVYRPLSQPKPTWVAGAKSESYAACEFGEGTSDAREDKRGLLTTNGSISPFVDSLMEELQCERVKAGGAGNKIMILLESSLARDGIDGSLLYIQDRGVSRWDSCAAEACLESFGGALMKLTPFVEAGDAKDSSECYTYLASKSNLDFIRGMANLTKYNRASAEAQELNQRVFDAAQVKPYSNLNGMVAFGKEWNTCEGRAQIVESIRRAAAKNPPSFD
ncbi:hypothetical protein ACHAXT_008181 [Thalassiosira profunda]